MSTLEGVEAHSNGGRTSDGTHVSSRCGTATSVAVAAGASLALIGGVLGHAGQQTTQRYAHLADSPVRQTSETIAESL